MTRRRILAAALLATLAGCASSGDSHPVAGLHVALQPELGGQRWTVVVSNASNATYPGATANLTLRPLNGRPSGGGQATLDVPADGVGQAVIYPRWVGQTDADYVFRLTSSTGELLDQETSTFHVPCLPVLC
jgi:hypothetical protein